MVLTGSAAAKTAVVKTISGILESGHYPLIAGDGKCPSMRDIALLTGPDELPYFKRPNSV